MAATSIGTAAAVAAVRRKFRAKGAIEGLFLAPMIVPVIILAIGIYWLFLRTGLTGTTVGFVAAHTVLALPFVYVPVRTSLLGFDSRLESAAAICGANRVATFFQITLPLVAPGVLTGAIFAFATSFDELIIALFIQSPYLQTLPVVMYNSVTRDIDPTIAAAGTLVLVISTTIVTGGSIYFLRRNHGH